MESNLYDKLPDIRCLTKKQIEGLMFAAQQTALRFCCPVYLVGSAVDSMYPNDIDIYIVVESDTYMRLFTNFNRLSESETDHMKNSRDMLIQQAKMYRKQKKYFEGRVNSWDFDVKFESKESFFKREGKRIRLDTIYEGLW